MYNLCIGYIMMCRDISGIFNMFGEIMFWKYLIELNDVVKWIKKKLCVVVKCSMCVISGVSWKEGWLLGVGVLEMVLFYISIYFGIMYGGKSDVVL